MPVVHFLAVLLLWMNAIAGGNDSLSATFAGKYVGCKESLDASVRVFDDHAVFTIDNRIVTVELTQVTAPGKQTFPLPDGWKRLEMSQGAKGIDLAVDGKAIGTILPTKEVA